jgi:hypothetical protein
MAGASFFTHSFQEVFYMLRSFTKLCGALVVVLSFATASYAQETNNDIIRPITKSGSAAFLFTISGLGTFGIGAPAIGMNAGVQSGVGMKYFVSDDLALRILLALATTSQDSTISTQESSQTNYGVGVGIEYHFRPLYSTTPYVGAVVGFAGTSNKSTNDGVTTTVSGTQFSIAAIAGFDWFFTRGIAAGAEMGLGFATNSGSTEVGSSSTDTNGPTQISLATNGNVHLVVYF